MARLGEAWVNIRANLKPLQAGLRKAFKSVSNMLKRITRTIIRAGKWAAVGFIAISTAAVKMAMDVEESENLFEVSMGKMARATRKWSEQLSAALGLNAFNIRRYVATFNVMLESMGIAPKKTAEMSKKLVELTYDMASFYNLKAEEAFEKIQSGITGMVIPLKRLGILVSETTVKQWALNQGMIEGKEQLTEIQKVMARFGVILQQTTKAQGDLQRTVGSATNVWRSFRTQIANVATLYGTELLPVFTKATKIMRDWLIENRERFVEWGKAVSNTLIKVVANIHATIDAIKAGKLEAVISVWTQRIIKIFRMMWDTLKVDVFPVAVEIGSALGKGIITGLAKEFPRIHAMFTGIEYLAQTKSAREFATQKIGGQQVALRLTTEERMARMGKPVGEF